MLLIIRPGFVDISIGAWFMIGSAVLFAITKMMAKSLSRTDSSPVIVAYVSFVMTPLALVAALFVWRWPTLMEFFWLTVIGVVATGAQLLLVQAYRHADMTVVEPLSFVRLLWAALLGFLIFSEFPDPWVWAGAAVIFLASISLARGETRA
jgi:drug/metabolite transporter (DMT)-like permease